MSDFESIWSLIMPDRLAETVTTRDDAEHPVSELFKMAKFCPPAPPTGDEWDADILSDELVGDDDAEGGDDELDASKAASRPGRVSLSKVWLDGEEYVECRNHLGKVTNTFSVRSLGKGE